MRLSRIRWIIVFIALISISCSQSTSPEPVNNKYTEEISIIISEENLDDKTREHFIMRMNEGIQSYCIENNVDQNDVWSSYTIKVELQINQRR
jgi:hypothetical protein